MAPLPLLVQQDLLAIRPRVDRAAEVEELRSLHRPMVPQVVRVVAAVAVEEAAESA